MKQMFFLSGVELWANALIWTYGFIGVEKNMKQMFNKDLTKNSWRKMISIVIVLRFLTPSTLRKKRRKKTRRHWQGCFICLFSFFFFSILSCTEGYYLVTRFHFLTKESRNTKAFDLHFKISQQKKAGNPELGICFEIVKLFQEWIAKPMPLGGMEKFVYATKTLQIKCSERHLRCEGISFLLHHRLLCS